MRIALCMGINDYYEHGIARGVIRYAKEQQDWELYGYGWMFRPMEDVHRWDGDGIIARIESESDAKAFAAMKLPVVDVAGAYSDADFYQVNNDDYQTGVNAAEFLVSRGFRRFAFCGVSSVRWSLKRLKGFVSTLDTPEIPVFERELSWWEQLGHSDELYSWLSSLSRPRALFACNDTAGVKASLICGELGIEVPEGIAILGVDNEDILCELSAPSLSSIRLDCEMIGYRAAEQLHRVLNDPGSGKSELNIPPGGVVERETTKVFVSEDPLVEAAMRYIQSSAVQGISVGDIADAVCASRRSLEVRFGRSAGKSVYSAIIETRIQHAKHLLVSTNETVEAVARESGFTGVQRFYVHFRRLTGMSPGEYRRRKN